MADKLNSTFKSLNSADIPSNQLILLNNKSKSKNFSVVDTIDFTVVNRLFI